MTPQEWAGAGAALLGALGGLAAMWKVWVDHRSGVSSDERQARRDQAEDRRDTIADRDRLIDQLQEQMRELIPRVDGLERELVAERAYNRVLVDHIYRGLPPPPPPRPA